MAQQQFHGNSRGTRKRCTTCGDSFITITIGGTNLVNGTECVSCEAEARIQALITSYHNKRIDD